MRGPSKGPPAQLLGAYAGLFPPGPHSGQKGAVGVVRCCSAHEVHIDDAQLAWLERTLDAAAGRPVVIFSHAPPQGSGLTVIQARSAQPQQDPAFMLACRAPVLKGNIMCKFAWSFRVCSLAA